MKLDFNKNERDALARLCDFMNIIKEAFGPRIPLRVVQTLCQVQMNEGRCQTELAAAINTSAGNASRDLRTLSNRTRVGGPGLGYVISWADPQNEQKRNYAVTHRGHLVLQRLGAAIAPRVVPTDPCPIDPWADVASHPILDIFRDRSA